MEMYEIIVNGEVYQIEADKNKPLLWVLRDDLGLTGAKYGCGIGQCGVCTVHLDKVSVRSCSILISDIGTAEITTIEEVAKDTDNPVIKAWAEINVPQCGYCQTGQIMTTVALLNSKSNPTNNEIENALNGNICRCGTYFRIRKAIKQILEQN